MATQYPPLHSLSYVEALKRTMIEKKKELIVMVIFGFILCFSAFFMKEGRGPGDSDNTILIIQFFMLTFGFLLLLTPFIGAYRLWFAMKFGLLSQAEVIEVKYDALSQDTIGAVDHGMAKGNLLIKSYDRQFKSAFEITEVWSKQLCNGSMVDVLIDPLKNKVLLVLGLHDGSKIQSEIKYSKAEINRTRILQVCLRVLIVFIPLMIVKLCSK